MLVSDFARPRDRPGVVGGAASRTLQNNRKYLADYDQQLEAIKAKLLLTMSDEDLARARAHSTFVWNIAQKVLNKNPAVREEQIAKLEELRTLYEYDGRRDCERGFKVYNSN